MKKAANYFFIFTLAILLSTFPFKSAFAQAEAYQVGGYFGIWGAYTINPELTSGYYDDWDYYEEDIDLEIDETSVIGAKIGYNHPLLRALALELEYGHMNPDMTYHGTKVGDVKFNNFMFNIFAKIPVGVVHPYWGAGLGFSHYDISTKYAEVSGSDDNTSYAWQLMTGLEIDLTYNLAVDIGYRYFVTELEFENDAEEDSDDIDFSTSMVTLGVKFRF